MLIWRLDGHFVSQNDRISCCCDEIYCDMNSDFHIVETS